MKSTIDVEVDYTYNAGEKRTHDYPGSGDYVEINTVKHNGKEILPSLSKEEVKQLEKEAMEEINNEVPF